jgi:branched-chain amino acid transport system substrate-binding protein
MKKLSLLLIISAIVAVAFPGVAGAGAADPDKSWQEAKTIKIGVALYLTGPGAQMGIDSRRGQDIALKEAGGKIDGKPVELVVYDEKGNPAEAMKAVTRLINQDKVHAIYGPQLSNSIFAVGPTIEAGKVPLMGGAVGASWTRQGWKYIFRPVVNTYYTNLEALKLFKRLNAKKVAFFHINDEFGIGSKKDMAELLEKAGGYEIVATETHRAGDQDFTGQCAKIVQSGADVVSMAVLSNDAGPIMKQLRKAGFTKPVIGDTSFSAKPVREVAGSAANGVYFVAPYILPDTKDDIKNFKNPLLQKYLETYFADYKEAPMSENTFRAYDGMRILMKAFAKAKSVEGPKVRDALESIDDYEGLGGKFNFKGANGDGIKTSSFFVIRDGKVMELD